MSKKKLHVDEKHLPSGPLCATCPIGGQARAQGNPQAYGFMVADGEMTSGVMIVAEALGHHEAVQEKALVGPSGFLMGRAFSRKKWKREEFRYSNVLRCQPHENTIYDGKGQLYPWASEAITHCAPYLDEEIDRVQPKVIVALGETALERLTGISAPVSTTRGYVFREQQDRCWVVSTYHPAFLLRGNFGLIHTFIKDIEKGRRIATEGYRYADLTCLMDPGMSQWQRYLEDFEVALDLNPDLVLAADIETGWSGDVDEDEKEDVEDPSFTIERISFAFEGDRGVSVPFREPYLPGIRLLLQSYAKKCFWNREFDRPRLEANGYPMNGEVVDTMDKWHVAYNALPRKLGFATSFLQHDIKMWKHLSKTEPEYYSVVDAIALWRNERDLDTILDAQGATWVYKTICLDLDPALRWMERAGMLIDPRLRAEAEDLVTAKLEDLERKIESTVPDNIKMLDIKKTRKGTINYPPEDVIELPGTKKERTCTHCGAHPVPTTHVTRKTLPKKAKGSPYDEGPEPVLRVYDDGKGISDDVVRREAALQAVRPGAPSVREGAQAPAGDEHRGGVPETDV